MASLHERRARGDSKPTEQELDQIVAASIEQHRQAVLNQPEAQISGGGLAILGARCAEFFDLT